jgi:hypothetical protein
MENNINDFLNHAPDKYLYLYNRNFYSPERLDYHPEGTLGAHINITLDRAMQSRDINLVFIAALHDICKGIMNERGGKREISINDGRTFIYHSNPEHGYHAYKYIMKHKEIQDWITSYGANLRYVTTVVKLHMKHKSYMAGLKKQKNGMGAAKREEYRSKLTRYELLYLNEFAKIDNMTKEYVPNKNLFPLNEKFAF